MAGLVLKDAAAAEVKAVKVQIRKPFGSASEESPYQHGAWDLDDNCCDFQAVIKGAPRPEGKSGLPWELELQGNVGPGLAPQWKLDSEAGALEGANTLTPTHVPPDKPLPSQKAAFADGKLTLEAMRGGKPVAGEQLIVERTVRIYADHLERDDENFGKAGSCKGGKAGWGFVAFGVAVNMRAMNSGATAAEAEDLAQREFNLLPKSLRDELIRHGKDNEWKVATAAPHLSSWNCHGATLHAFNGAGHGWYAWEEVPPAIREGCENIRQVEQERADPVNLGELRRGDIIVYRGWVVDEKGARWTLEHSQTVLRQEGGKWMTFGANNEPLTAKGGLDAETWRWALSPAGEWAKLSRFKPTRIEVWR